jgi:hypothetical protein
MIVADYPRGRDAQEKPVAIATVRFVQVCTNQYVGMDEQRNTASSTFLSLAAS